MNRLFLLCLLCVLNPPAFTSATEENPAQILDHAFIRYVALVQNSTDPSNTEELSAIKSTFKAFATRQDLDKDTTFSATLGLGLVAFLGGPGPRDYRKAWRHFEHIQKSEGAPMDVRNKAANFMILLITRGHIPEVASPRGKILMLLSTHKVRDDVRERVLAFFAAKKSLVPSVNTDQTPPHEEHSDWEDSPDISSASASPAASEEDDEGEESDSSQDDEEALESTAAHPYPSLEKSAPHASEVTTCARTRPYRAFVAQAPASNKRQRR